MKRFIIIIILLFIIGCGESPVSTDIKDIPPQSDNVSIGAEILPLHISLVLNGQNYEYDCISVEYINYSGEDILSINTGNCKDRCGIDIPSFSKVCSHFLIIKK